MFRLLVINLLIITFTTSSLFSAPYKTDAEKAMVNKNKITISKTKSIDVTKYVTQINSNKISKKKLVIIYTILQNTEEHYIHNMNGVTTNKVYLFKDGHQEGVYDKNGTLVKDGINNGSYNYAPAKKAPLAHFLLDMSPWISWGTTPKDPTTKKERIFSYLSDFEGGLRTTLELNQNNKLQKKIEFDKNQKNVLGLFMHIIEFEENPILFELFEQKTKISDKQILKCLKQLESGFYKVYLE